MILLLVVMLAAAAVGDSDAAPTSELPSRLDVDTNAHADADVDAVEEVRVPRRARARRLEDKALTQLSQLAQDHEPLKRAERSGEEAHHDYVDYGAHTGPKGSFGWYADFPVIQHH